MVNSTTPSKEEKDETTIKINKKVNKNYYLVTT